ncbi:fimbria/pilus outer membrane usher protein [Aestuariivirga sp.]|uniref:fimbria/pilus outer membrane usher protein n=1 Tax=Aestuariivirga sp. TaxID=2650926 RepID=UPI0039E56526
MDQSRRRPNWLLQSKVLVCLLIVLLLAIQPARADSAGAEGTDLQLDVRINGYPSNLIAAFRQMPDGHMASPRSELKELGVAVPDGPPGDIIQLNTIPGLSYVYDPDTQSIALELPNSSRIAKSLGNNPFADDFARASPGTGLLVNYTAFGAGNYDIPGEDADFSGANVTLDARAFSRFGTLRQSGLLGTTAFDDVKALRLDTTWAYSDQQRMLSYRLGDIISGGLRWTRPVRMGGGQIERNFGLRPDLITMPLPHLSGSAAVPSTLEVYQDNIRTYSADVQPGPFSIDNLPVFTNSGTARMVLTDASGRQVATEADFFTSPELLAKGLLDYSADLGLARRNYGTESFDYDRNPAFSGSARYGVTDAVTGEAHGEAMFDLVNAGVGAVASAREFGLFSGAVSASAHDGDKGLLMYASWSAQYGRLALNASTSRTLGTYWDIAAATRAPDPDLPFYSDVPKALDQVSIGYSLPDYNTGLGLSFIHQEDGDGKVSYLISGSATKTFDFGPTLFASAYYDTQDDHDFGGYVGVSWPLGARTMMSGGMSVTNHSIYATADAYRPLGVDAGDYGWRVNRQQGDAQSTTAGASYRTSVGVADGSIYQGGKQVSGNASFSGAFVVADDSVFASDTIMDSFAVVDTRTPGVGVSYENRYAGKTRGDGKLLLPGLRSFQKNRIAIDVNDLPLDAEASSTEQIVVPGDGAGVVVDFGVKTDMAGVIVTLTGPDGKAIPAGSEALLNNQGDSFVVGYDGEVYVTGAEGHNSITVHLSTGDCTAQFQYTPSADGQAAAGPVACL